MIRRRLLLLPAVLLVACVQAAAAPGESAAAESEPHAWAFSGSANAFLIPDDRDFLQPTINADRDALHLEARYNYEALETASLWIGCNLSAAHGDLALAFTPMAGVAFGEASGIAPGYHVTLDWRKLEFYSEGEYLFDLDDSEDSFLYSWSQLTLSPLDWLDAGLVVQRTRVYAGARDIQRGVLLGVHYRRVGLTANVFNPDDPEPTYVIALSVD